MTSDKMTANGTKPKAIVIGAGVGGCATAARLAHAGFDVDVYEKNAFSGGRCSLIHHDGYRFDQGPSLFLLPPLFRQLYSDLGTSLEEHIDLIQCHPNYVVHFHDGEKVELSSDRAALAQEVERFEGPAGIEGLEGFLREAYLHAKLSYDLVLSKSFPSILCLLRPSFIWNVASLHAFTSMWKRCEKHFRTDRMRRAFSFGSMYMGSSPFDSPGTYTLLQWTETCEGIWYPRGGFNRVPESLLEIAKSYGARVHYNAAVDTVTYDNGRATGVKLADGTEQNADVVVVNADLVWAHNNLFRLDAPTSKVKEVAKTVVEKAKNLLDPKLAKRLEGKPHSRVLFAPKSTHAYYRCSSISFYWAMDSVIPQLNAHNIFLAEHYKESFDDIFKRGGMPREPSFYVNVPSRVDPSAAPEGKDTLVVLVPTGHLIRDSASTHVLSDDGVHDSQDWPVLVERARGQIIEILEARLGIKGLREKIVWEEYNTPLTWKDKFNLTHGSILGIVHDFFNVLSFRHQARHRKLKGAYFVGASAHPGTGVPIAIAGSKLCMEAILADLNMPEPESYTAASRPLKSSLDYRHPRQLSHVFSDAIPMLIFLALGALSVLVPLLLWVWYTQQVDIVSWIKAPKLHFDGF